MPAIVVPYRGETGKNRLAPIPADARRALALAMLGDVLTAASVAGQPIVVTADEEALALAHELDARTVTDPGGGQGAAVQAGLELAAGRTLVVNADVPAVVPADLRALEAAIPASGIALVEAADGTTNALGLARPGLFEPLYGPASAERFRELGHRTGLDVVSASIANLVEDVDEPADLERLGLRAGPRTIAAAASARLIHV